MKHLHRSKYDRVIFGVCGGLGEYFSVDPVVFRLLFILLTILGGSGILLYIIAALIMPNDSEPAHSPHDAGAKFKNRVHGLASELRSKGEEGGMKGLWIGWVVVLIGVILLINQFFPKNIISWNVVLAVIIIVFGVRIMRSRSSSGSEAKKAVPLEAVENEAKKSEFLNEKMEDRKTPHIKEVVREVHHHHHRGSGVFGLLFGLIIVAAGFVFLAQNLGLVSGIDLSYIMKFWPVFIIVAGLSLLSRGTWLGALLSFLITLAVIVALVSVYIFPSAQREMTVKDFRLSSSDDVNQIALHIAGGAGLLKITGGGADAVSGHFESNFTSLFIVTSTEIGTDNISIETQGSMKRLGGKFINSLDLALTEDLPVNVSVDAGASKIDIDASDLKLQKLDIQSGASSIKLALGSLLASSSVKISAGASSVDITRPKDVGMKVVADAGLSSKNFFDFKQVDEDTYESINYGSAAKKIELLIDAGVSSITIRSYE